MRILIKKLIKVIIPAKAINKLKATVLYWPDIKRYAFKSNTFYKLDNQAKARGYMTLLYHIIEKGLTMPETRLGFGTKIVLELTEICDAYIKSGRDASDYVFVHSIEVLNEYVRYHNIHNFKLENNIEGGIKELSAKTGIKTFASQLHFSSDDFFKYHQSSFDLFCRSRHTSRNFLNKDVPMDVLYHCIEQASSSPSDCNRQPSRVVIVRNRKTLDEILQLQNGNRGFGHLINTMLVITSDLSVFQGNERNEPFLNAGMFSMTLLYALHNSKIGACLLNWAATDSNDKELRKLLNVPDNEQIALLIGCGYIPDEIDIALSPRFPVSDITRTIL